MIYVYGITDEPCAPLPAEPGLNGARLSRVVVREVVAVVSPVAEGRLPVTRGNVVRHELVLEALMQNCTVLPARFGVVAADEESVHSALATCYSEFVADLARLRGHQEVGVRVLWDGDPRMAGAEARPSTGAREADTGRAYLLRRMEEERRSQAGRAAAERLASELHNRLSRCAAEGSYELLITPRLLLTAAYLVAREQITAFRQEVEDLSAAHADLGLVCSGPWPPYSFVRAGV